MNTKLVELVSNYNLVSKLSINLYKQYISYISNQIDKYCKATDDNISKEMLYKITTNFLIKELNKRGIGFNLKEDIVTFKIKDFKRFLLLSNTQNISILKSLEKTYTQDFLYAFFIEEKHYSCQFSCKLDTLENNLYNLTGDTVNILTLSTRNKLDINSRLDMKIRQCIASALIMDIIPYCEILNFTKLITNHLGGNNNDRDK